MNVYILIYIYTHITYIYIWYMHIARSNAIESSINRGFDHCSFDHLVRTFWNAILRPPRSLGLDKPSPRRTAMNSPGNLKSSGTKKHGISGSDDSIPGPNTQWSPWAALEKWVTPSCHGVATNVNPRINITNAAWFMCGNPKSDEWCANLKTSAIHAWSLPIIF